MIYLAEKLKFISEEDTKALLPLTIEVSKTINGLISYLRSSIEQQSS